MYHLERVWSIKENYTGQRAHSIATGLGGGIVFQQQLF